MQPHSPPNRILPLPLFRTTTRQHFSSPSTFYSYASPILPHDSFVSSTLPPLASEDPFFQPFVHLGGSEGAKRYGTWSTGHVVSDDVIECSVGDHATSVFLRGPSYTRVRRRRLWYIALARDGRRRCGEKPRTCSKSGSTFRQS